MLDPRRMALAEKIQRFLRMTKETEQDIQRAERDMSEERVQEAKQLHLQAILSTVPSLTVPSLTVLPCSIHRLSPPART